MNEIKYVEDSFKSHEVHISRLWLESCIEWCKEENLPPNYTLKNLQVNVFQQWLLLDLRDLEVPCLPLDLSKKEKYVLNRNYTLQLMQVVDISKPKYWQLQRIRNDFAKNLEKESESSNRVLRLTLTDGVQEVEAMEYKTVKCLNLNLPPGSKIRLIGPITVRRGRLMLEDKNVKLVGGEVDSLLISNAAENILAKSLNRPLNDNPNVIQENLLTDVSAVEVRNNVEAHNNININNIPNQTRNQAVINFNTNTASNNINPPSDDFIDEFKIDEAMLLAADVFEETNFSNQNHNLQPTRIATRSKTPDMFEDMDVDFGNIDIPDTFNKAIPDTVSKPSTSKKQQPLTTFFEKAKEPRNTTHVSIKPPEVINISDDLEMDDYIEKEMTNLNEMEDLHNERQVLLPKAVVWTVEKLTKTIPNVSNGKFKIKAKFKSIVQRLRVEDNLFNLIIDVGDDSGVVTVKLRNDVVEQLMGVTVGDFEEFLTLSKGDPEVRRKAMDALTSLQTVLLDLDNVLEVFVSAKEKFPLVLKIL